MLFESVIIVGFFVFLFSYNDHLNHLDELTERAVAGVRVCLSSFAW